jgi:hypothetical protein
MGITINDELDFYSGVSTTGCYASFGTQSITIEKNEDGDFELSGFANIWVDEAARDLGKSPLKNELCIQTVASNDLDTNLYELLYTVLKSKYTSVVDC